MNTTSIEEQIHHYLNGNLSTDEKDTLWNELIQDPDAYEYLLTEIHVRDHFKIAKTQPEIVAPIPLKTWLYIAAALAVIVVGLQFLRFTEDEYIQQIMLNRINDSAYESVTAFRDGDLAISEGDSLLALALDITYSGKIDEAKKRFKEIQKKFPDGLVAAKAHLNLGIIYYNNEEFRPAISEFDQTIIKANDNRIIVEKSLWLKANAHFKLNEFELAHQAVKEAFEMNGSYQQDAFELYRYLEYKLGYTDYEEVDEN